MADNGFWGFWKRFEGWLGRKLLHPIFLLLTVLILALMVRPVFFRGEKMSQTVLWLVAILVLLALLDLADVRRFLKADTPLDKVKDLPPLGLVVGSVRGLLSLAVIAAFFFFLLVAPGIFQGQVLTQPPKDEAQLQLLQKGLELNLGLLEKVVMLIGGWVGIIIGFYFGARFQSGVTPTAPGVTLTTPGVTPTAPGVTLTTPGVTPTAPGVTPTAPPP